MSMLGSTRHRRWWRRCSAPAVALLSVAVLSSGVSSADRHFDEDDWLARARLFGPYVAGRWRLPIWSTTAAIDHPLLATHLFGLACAVGGDAAKGLPQLRPEPASREHLYRPAADPASSSVVVRARWVVVGFGALVCVSAFIACRQLGGGLEGACVAGALLANPLLRSLSQRATGDVPAQGLILASLAALFIAAHRVELARFSQGCRWLVAAGLLGGLASSARLDGLIALAALVCCSILMILSVPSKPSRAGPSIKGGRRFPIALGALAGLGIGGLALALTNPPLTTHPVRAVRSAYAHRLWTVRLQGQLFGRERLSGFRERATATGRYVGGEVGTLRSLCSWPGSVWLDRAAALGGLAVLLRRGLRTTRWLSVACWLMAGGVWIGSVCLVVPFAWSRYFLGPVLYVTMLEGLFIGWLIVRLGRAWPRRREPRRQFAAVR